MKSLFSALKWLCLFASFSLIIPASLIYLSAPQALLKNQQFKENEFSPAIHYVESFKSLSSRLPSVDEFESWKLSVGRENQAFFYQTEGSLYSEDCRFGEVSKGSYGISIWRGEWYECYASSIKAYSFDDAAATTRIQLVKLSSAAFIFFCCGFLFQWKLESKATENKHKARDFLFEF